MRDLYIKATDKAGMSKEAIIMLYLERAGRATTQDIADALDCSANTARKWLYRLRDAGKVQANPHFYGRGVYLYRWSKT